MREDPIMAAKPSSHQRPTLEAIAREASVSLSTVSKVLNGRPGVAETTRARVEKLLHERKYGRGGVDERGGLVELVTEQPVSDWSVEIVRGAERIARESGTILGLSALGTGYQPSRDWINGVLQRKPLAVILQFSNLTEEDRQRLTARNIPFVVVDPAGHPPEGVPSVGATNRAGAASAASHLLDLGHTRIAVISGPEELMICQERVAGYREALEQRRVPIHRELFGQGGFNRRDGERETLKLLSLDDPPTGIVCANDMQAIGAINAAFRLGLNVPRDVSVVGFDDVPPAAYARPPLTTVRQPLGDMAEVATRMALDLRRGPVAETRIELETTLVVRESTAPPAR